MEAGRGVSLRHAQGWVPAPWSPLEVSGEGPKLFRGGLVARVPRLWLELCGLGQEPTGPGHPPRRGKGIKRNSHK